MLEKYGGWPVVKGEDWNEDDWDWIDTIGKMTHDGFKTELIFSSFTIRDLQNASRYVLSVRLSFTVIQVQWVLLFYFFFRSIDRSLV